MELIDNDAKKRVARFIESGEDLNGYMVKADRLREVIRNVVDVSETTKEDLISDLDTNFIQEAELIDCFQLGMFLGGCFARHKDQASLIKIIADVKNLDKLPFVSVRNEAVN